MVRKVTGSAILALALAMPTLWATPSPLRAEGAIPTPAPAPAPGQFTASTKQLIVALRLGDVITVMEAEGLDYGAQLRDEMFPDRPQVEWDHQVARIYDQGRVLSVISARLEKELQDKPDVTRAALAFFETPTGQKILSLEVEARRALMDDAAEAAAKEALADMEAKSAPRLEALNRFAKANDLIEMNVMGAMNANLAFYRGMADGGALDGLSEQDMLSEVWAQEAQVRADAEDWLWPYLALAYQPLSDEELQSYQRFSETPAGRSLNAALFAAFDEAFVQISRDLGRAAARMVQGEDI